MPLLSNEWFKELFYPQCGSSRWCHVGATQSHLTHAAMGSAGAMAASAPMNPRCPNPSVSQFKLGAAQRTTGHLWDPV